MSERMLISVICTPGFEAITRDEMQRIGVAPLPPAREGREEGVIMAETDSVGLYSLNLHLRTAARVRVQLETFRAAAFSELRKKASRLTWAPYLHPGTSVVINVTTHVSALYHKKGIAERVAGAISDALGKPTEIISAADEESCDIPVVYVRLLRNVCTISVDSSGDHLHRRGYRLDVAKAPLRENLAASMLLAAGWPGDVPLVDPFCGSGTIAIEAAMLASGIPPGQGRTFAFSKWPSFDTGAWEQVKAAVPAPKKEGLPLIYGMDRDAGAVAASKANAGRAGVGDTITWACHSISDLELPETPGWIVTNPPYGERIKGGPDLRNLYARMGTVWRQKAQGWQIYYVTSSPRWSAQLGMPSDIVTKFNHGGIPVAFLRAKQDDKPS